LTSNIGEAQTSAVGLARFIEVCRVQFKTCQEIEMEPLLEVGTETRK